MSIARMRREDEARRYPTAFREEDAEAGEWTAIYADGRREPRFGFLSADQRHRLPVVGSGGDEERSPDPAAPDPYAFGSTEAQRRLAARLLHPRGRRTRRTPALL